MKSILKRHQFVTVSSIILFIMLLSSYLYRDKLMYIKHIITGALVSMSVSLPGMVNAESEMQGSLPVSPGNAQDWYNEGQASVNHNAEIAQQAVHNARRKAKNIILFVGDGMGISTVTAARIFAGQNQGMDGEEHELFFETFPHLALSKTYNTNQQTPDSAGTMTAMMTGVKTKAGIISVNQETIRGDCYSQQGNELVTALELAEIIGMSTGIVTSARITHATPAAAYAHIMDRNFEDDRDASKIANPGDCVDIARQLVEMPSDFKQYNQVDGLEVALGGGRRSFLKRIEGADPESGGKGEREDGRDLTKEWVDHYVNAAYVWNEADFNAVNSAAVDHLLGLFAMSHMQYEPDRHTDTAGEPSLSAMTMKAIAVLQKNKKEGFFLMVESGRIDHAHHATNPFRALSDTVEFANAVQTAYENTDPKETLIIVTADHSHVFTIAGYPIRGNPILGKVVSNDSSGNPETEEALAADGRPYTTLGYQNGHGFYFLPGEHTADAIKDQVVNVNGHVDLTGIDTKHEGFHSETLVPLNSATHAAEDVAIYATGPGSSLVNGVMEQNAIYHVMNKAANLEKRAKKFGFRRNGN